MSLREPTVVWGPDTVTFTFDVTDEVLELVRWGVPLEEAKEYYRRMVELIQESTLRDLQSDCEESKS